VLALWPVPEVAFSCSAFRSPTTSPCARAVGDRARGAVTIRDGGSFDDELLPVLAVILQIACGAADGRSLRDTPG
jgi:hypothetical protein